MTDASSNGLVDYYTSKNVSVTDYGIWGDALPQRNANSSDYSMGFNGKENDNEIIGNGRWQDYGMRMYRTDLGRFFSIDLLFAKYPYQSPYAFVGGGPILNKEINGNDYAVYIDHNKKTIIVKATYYTKKGDDASHESALLATTFWNDQSGKFQYSFGAADAKTLYDISFELTVQSVEIPAKQVSVDRATFDAGPKLNTDQSSNVFKLLPDNSDIFQSTSKKTDLGITKNGNYISVKESEKKSDVGAHEVGHSLGLNHYSNGLMTESVNQAEHSTSVDKFTIQGIFDNIFKPTGKQAKGTRYEEGKAPEKFEKGSVITK